MKDRGKRHEFDEDTVVPFCSGRADSRAVGNESVKQFLLACTGGFDSGRGEGLRLAGSCIIAGDGRDNLDRRECLTTKEGLCDVDIE